MDLKNSTGMIKMVVVVILFVGYPANPLLQGFDDLFN